MTHLFYFAKLIFLLLLACLCFYFFGLPLFNKYFAKEVTVVESLEKRDFLKSPSITICPDVSWKNSSLSGIEPVGYFKEQCPMAKSAQEFKSCVENRTYNFSETIESASHGFVSRTAKNLSDPGLWTWDMPLAVGGRCYTLNYEANLTMDQTKDSLLFEPTLNRSVHVILHESNFFIPTLNPLTLPTVTPPP